MAALAGLAGLGCGQVRADVRFTESYTGLETGSFITLDIDLPNVPFQEDFKTTIPLSGRVDVDFRYSDIPPTGTLEAMRVRRITLYAADALNAESHGFSAQLRGLGIHMGDAMAGSGGGWATIGNRQSIGGIGWSQAREGNEIHFEGTLRVRAPFGGGYETLIDLSKAEPTRIGLSGIWELTNFGASSHFRLAITGFQPIRGPVFVPSFLTVTVEETRPFAFPEVPPTFSEWLASFGLADGANGNSDGDELDNLAEFALGRNPAVSDASDAAPPVELEVANNGIVTGTFERNVNLPGIGYYLQVSGDLLEWKTIAASIDGEDTGGVAGGIVLRETSTEAPGILRVQVRAPELLGEGESVFARLLFKL